MPVGVDRCLALLVGVLMVAASLVGAPPASASHEVTPARAGGEDRFATAVEISRATFPGGAPIALLARADAFADALAAAPLARQSPAGPILLVTTTSVPEVTRTELRRLGVTEIVLLGGTAAISRAVEEDLDAEFDTVRRVAGGNRFHTAAEVARAIAAAGTIGTIDGRRAVFVASGTSFADALAAGPVASARPAVLPILLTPRDRLASEAAQAVTDLGIEHAVVVGGTAVVGPEVVQALRDRGLVVHRISGPNRFATAARLADLLTTLTGAGAERVVLARGDDFPDALAAGPHAGSIGAPIVLAGTPTRLGDETRGWFRDACLPIRVVRAVGGTAAVSTAVLGEAVTVAQDECHGTWGLLPVAPVDNRMLHTATWSGERMLVWGGGDGSGVFDNGIALRPANRDWRVLPPAPIEPRFGHVAEWTGSELVVWGGMEAFDHLAECFPDGAAYDPSTGTWRTLPAAPIGPRCGHASVWTGSELVVWGGHPGGGIGAPLHDDGAAYNPATNTWRPVPSAPVPARAGHVAAWTGTEMLVFGGTGPDFGDARNDGAAWNPVTNMWRTIPASPLPPRFGLSGGWTGAELVVLGGADGPTLLRDAAAYDPAADSWRPLPDMPGAHTGPVVVRGDPLLYVLGGDDDVATPSFMALDPAASTWLPLPEPPGGSRGQHEAVWTGSELLVWGGNDSQGRDAPGIAWRR